MTVALLLGVLPAACKVSSARDSGTEADSVASASANPDRDTSTSKLLVAGDSLRFVEHPEILPAGFPASAKLQSLRNPYETDKAAIATGAKLFIAYNCLDCHGADGSGAMGPSFQDGRWHFGGSAGEVFVSIYQGRPDGMPAWGGRITNDQIWMLTAYVRSLSSKDLSTENFTGKTVERTGH
jgi:cytochrome c oxidase cbb3-type subunit 3